MLDIFRIKIILNIDGMPIDHFCGNLFPIQLYNDHTKCITITTPNVLHNNRATEMEVTPVCFRKYSQN